MLRVLLSFLCVGSAVATSTIPQPGQRYLRVGSEGRYVQDGGFPPYAFLRSHVLTLKKVEPMRVVFEVDGLGEVTREGSPRMKLPDLAPVIADPQVAHLRREYVGKQVWSYGGLNASCFIAVYTQVGFSVPFRTPLKITDVFRIARPMELTLSGGEDFGGGQVVVKTAAPLVFLVAATPAASTGGVRLPSDPVDDMLAQCGDTYSILLPDFWAVDRVFSLTPPGPDLPSQHPVPAEDPANVGRLNRRQYAWLYGFPTATLGTVQQLLALKTWKYGNPPFTTAVHFDSNGLLSEVDVPIMP